MALKSQEQLCQTLSQRIEKLTELLGRILRDPDPAPDCDSPNQPSMCALTTVITQNNESLIQTLGCVQEIFDRLEL
jgi:hypothetical protein